MYHLGDTLVYFMNYSNIKPRLWLEKHQGNDLSRDIYLESYISDCQWHSKASINTPQPPNTVRVCSYNIHKWLYPGGKYKNIESVYEIISKIDPDIIGLQELTYSIDESKISKSFEDLGFEYRTDTKSRRAECLVLMFSKILVDDITPSKIEKFATIGHFTSPQNNEFVVCNLHLDAYDHTGLKRQKQIRKVIKNLSPEYPTIVIGDFNALKIDDYDEDEKRWLMRHNQGYALDFQTIDILEEAGFRDTFEPRSFKYSTWSARRVDFIFTRGITPEKLVNTGVLYTPVSDHIPIFVDFNFRI